VLELIDVLRERNIPFSSAETSCVISTGDDNPPALLYLIGALSLLSIGAAVFALRRRVGVFGHAASKRQPPKEPRQPPLPKPPVPPGASAGDVRSPRGRLKKSAVLSGLENGRALRIELSEPTGADGFVIGRAKELCHYTIDDSRVSRRHARLLWDGQRLMVEDLNATNATVVNERTLTPFAPTELHAGDKVFVAVFELRVSIAD
jgi:hypothetical protein